MEYGEITEILNKVYKKVGDSQFSVHDVSMITNENIIGILKHTGMLAETDGVFQLTKDGLEMVN
jgi:hypothetical protein